VELAGYWAGATACGLVLLLLAVGLITVVAEDVWSAVWGDSEEDPPETPVAPSGPFPLDGLVLTVLWAGVAALAFRRLIDTIRAKEREW